MPRKSKEEILRLAASMMGKKGGKSRSEKKIQSSRRNIQKAISVSNSLSSDDMKQRSINAVTARWINFESGMSNEEFREKTAHLTAQEIADGIGVTYTRVISWRRKVKPARIPVEEAKQILAFLQTHKHTD